ncbi:MAK10-like protein [Tanacetum coccineum]|uniref:MAK10-like protein n=1 Tax=Tanacetum coccineum TaxID=301880 RepID=A0ABQ5C022_9ASTR
MVPLRSDTIRLVQNRCSFHELRSEDPNQHLKDFLKLVDSLDLDGENRERTRLLLFQFSLRDQASNWLEQLLAGSITTWKDLTTRFLAQLFPPGRTAKLRNDILMFQQHHRESAITLPRDVPSTSDRRLIELENQVQCLMEAHLALTQPTQVNKITTSCEICSGPHDTQYCIEDPEKPLLNTHPREPTRREENEAEEEGSVEPSKTEYINRENANETNEEVESEKKVEEETEGETEEEKDNDPKHFDTFTTMKELRYHEWLLKNPQPPWVKAKIRTGNVLEDTTSVIDHYLGSVVFGKQFMEAIGLVYNKEEGTVMFERDSDDDNCEKPHYLDSLDLGLEYRHDEYVCRGIRSLMATKSRRKNKGEVTKHFKTLSLDESRSPDFDLFSEQEEYSEEEVAETMAETMEQYMSKTRADYGSGIARPKIEDKDTFELKGQFLKDLHDNSFSGSDHEDANEHIEKVLEIVDLFHIPNITIDQVMLRAFPMSLTGAASQMQEVVLFYNGLDVPTSQILDSRGAIPSKTAADVKVAIQEMAEYSQKWHNGTSRTRIV